MPLYYLDSSALVKLYVLESGTDELLRLTNGRRNNFTVLSLAPLEVRSAVRRRERAGDIDGRTASLLLDLMEVHLETIFTLQPLSDIVLATAREVTDRYALRAYDAIQLAGCLNLMNAVQTPSDLPTFVCSDRQLNSAARSEKLAVFDPTAQQ